MIILNKPLVTIITPCYNHEKYLEDYFKSIINQNYKNIELVIIDDASRDNSKQIINDYQKKLQKRFVNYKFINRQKNVGLVKNCNLGLKLSKGKYLILFASDDIMFPNKIKENIQFIENTEYGMAYSDGYKVKENFKYEDMNNLNNSKKTILDSLVKKEEAYSGFVANQLLEKNFIPAPTVIIKRKVFDEVGNYNEDLSFEDYDMWLKIAEKYKIGYIDDHLVFYRQRNYSMSGALNKSQKYESIKSLEKIINKHINSSEYSYNDMSKKLSLINLYKKIIDFGFLYNEKKLLDKYFNKLIRMTIFPDLKVVTKYLVSKVFLLHKFIIKIKHKDIYQSFFKY